MKLLFAIAAGGALGAVSRHYVAASVMRVTGSGTIAGFPIGIMTVNIVGSLLMGVIVSLLAMRLNLTPEMKSFLTVGFLGAFTTFSTFSMEAVMLFERGQMLQAAGYVLGSVLFGIAGFVVGIQIGKIL